MSFREIATVIGACPADEQVDIYLASVWKTHPPSYDLATALAPDGARLLPFIVAKMRMLAGSSDEFKMETLLVLAEEIQLASGSIEPSTIETMNSIVMTMMDEDIKRNALEQLDYIRRKGSSEGDH
jgi:hypothetical protein